MKVKDTVDMYKHLTEKYELSGKERFYWVDAPLKHRDTRKLVLCPCQKKSVETDNKSSYCCPECKQTHRFTKKSNVHEVDNVLYEYKMSNSRNGSIVDFSDFKRLWIEETEKIIKLTNIEVRSHFNILENYGYVNGLQRSVHYTKVSVFFEKKSKQLRYATSVFENKRNSDLSTFTMITDSHFLYSIQSELSKNFSYEESDKCIEDWISRIYQELNKEKTKYVSFTKSIRNLQKEIINRMYPCLSFIKSSLNLDYSKETDNQLVEFIKFSNQNNRNQLRGRMFTSMNELLHTMYSKSSKSDRKKLCKFFTFTLSADDDYRIFDLKCFDFVIRYLKDTHVKSNYLNVLCEVNNSTLSSEEYNSTYQFIIKILNFVQDSKLRELKSAFPQTFDVFFERTLFFAKQAKRMDAQNENEYGYLESMNMQMTLEDAFNTLISYRKRVFDFCLETGRSDEERTYWLKQIDSDVLGSHFSTTNSLENYILSRTRNLYRQPEYREWLALTSTKFEYTDSQRSFEDKIGSVSFMLPPLTCDYEFLGQELHICVGNSSYVYQTKKNKGLIVIATLTNESMEKHHYRTVLELQKMKNDNDEEFWCLVQAKQYRNEQVTQKYLTRIINSYCEKHQIVMDTDDVENLKESA